MQDHGHLGLHRFPHVHRSWPSGADLLQEGNCQEDLGKAHAACLFPFYLAIVLGISHLVNEHFVKNKKVGAIAGKVAQTLAGWTEGMLRDRA